MAPQATAIIARKRDGGIHSEEEIRYLIDRYHRGALPDYQMAAWAMAVYLRGMSREETAYLTDCMLNSGLTMKWPADAPPVVDKHSTGGIGDKVSLVLAPLLACCGLWVPMISGRGLGPTGGTLDKLESIPGFRTDLSWAEIQAITQHEGCVITGASDELAPADRRLYALRDVTATVASVPLITASIMSKKLAEGLTALVLDVKWGSGAFMKSRPQAEELARSLVDTGQRMGVKTTALITDMNQPLGRMAGNSVEVDEALQTLAGKGPPDLVEVTIALGAELLFATGRAASTDEASRMLDDHLQSGAALTRFEAMVRAQGGDLDRPRPKAPAHEIVAPHAGFVRRMDVERLGQAVIALGGGRRILSDRIDHAVGFEMLVRLGDGVGRGQPLIRVLAQPGTATHIDAELQAAIELGEQPLDVPPLVMPFTKDLAC